jgi:hypothetical protein
MFEWHKRFKEGQESLQDDEQKGCPSTSRTEESTKVIQKCLTHGRILSDQKLEEVTGINRKTVHKILVEDLKKTKVCTCFVLLLTLDQKHHCSALSVEFVKMMDDNRSVLKRIVMGDENWCFMYGPETKYQRAT